MVDESTLEDMKKVEAVLFTTGRYMGVDEIAQVCEIGSVGYVKDLLHQLVGHYSTKKGALQVVEQDGKYKLNIRKEFGRLANKLVSSSEFDNPTTKTLAIIAYKNPALQSDIIKARGNKAYDHIKILKEEGLVTSEKNGRTRMLKLTPKFFEYFDTAGETVKEVFQDVELTVKRHVAEKAGMTVDEVDEKNKLVDDIERKEKEKKQQGPSQEEASSQHPDELPLPDDNNL
jgi:segregation and condensation protein B